MSSPPQRPVVLLVEDSEDDVFFFRHALKKGGVACALFHVGDGSDAIQYLKAGIADPADPGQPWPDLVFLDLKLPSFSGFEILGWIREQKLERPLDVAILSGSDHASDVERALSLGATEYLVKPIPVELLLQKIARWQASRPGNAAATRAGAGAL